jgi:hypothetical protein
MLKNGLLLVIGYCSYVSSACAVVMSNLAWRNSGTESGRRQTDQAPQCLLSTVLTIYNGVKSMGNTCHL